jgi:bis(5'-nucleosyl)-tetraphosphatase (symmetrical)
MATYAIGDVQGCFNELMRLLDRIHFDEKKDTLWFAGDMVNRGSQSLDVLRFIKSLGDKHKTVLGNHDLHLLAVAYGSPLHSNDTFDAILTAPDREELIHWLRCRPLFFYDENLGYGIAHAGLAPSWDLHTALRLAHEVEVMLQSASSQFFLKTMYGNQPDYWEENLSGRERLRCIINYFTRMRLCYPNGRLELAYKGLLKDKPDDLVPWFQVPERLNKELKIIFGHWAALGGRTDVPRVYALDTGCVWGNSLTALRLEDEQRFSIECGDCKPEG